MRVLYLFPEEFTGAFAREYHVYRLAESLAAAGCDVTLVGACTPEVKTTADLRGVFGGGESSARLRLILYPRLLRLGPLRIRNGSGFYRQVSQLLASEKFDVVYTMHLKAASYLKLHHPKLSLVFEAHEVFADSHPSGSSKFRSLTGVETDIYGHARAVVAISEFLAESLRERYKIKQPLHVQHDGIDETMLIDASGCEPHQLIYAGSLQPWKGVPVAVEAMRLLPDYHLTIAGGEGAKLDELKRRAPDNVTFTGRVSRTALLPMLRRARIGLMPNLPEPRSALYTFPLKLLEYSAAGKAIIASHIPVFDRLDTGQWVKLVPSGSPEALVQAVRAMESETIDSAAAQTWARQFLWPRQGDRLRDFLASTLS